MIWLGLSGGHRSGTTILAHILNQHPEVGLFVEYGLENYVRSIDAIFGRSDEIEKYDNAVEESTLRATSMPVVVSCESNEENLAPPSEIGSPQRQDDPTPQTAEAFYLHRDQVTDLPYRGPFRPVRLSHGDQLLLAPYRLVFPDRNLRVVGDKMPQFGENNDLVWLRRRLPNFRLLHIVRNPLDVINSSLNRRNNTRAGKDVWHIDTIEQAAAEWITDWNWAMAAKAELGDDMLIIKYEDMSGDIERVLRKIETFLSLTQRLLPTFMPLPETLRLYAMDMTERSQAEAWFRAVTEAWPDNNIEELASLFPTLPAICGLGETVDFSANGNGWVYTASGFSCAEEDGTWTDGESAEIVANFGLDTELCRISGGYIPIAYCERLRVLVNGAVAGVVITGAPTWEAREFALDFMHVSTDRGGTVIRLEPDRPKLLGEYPENDPRRLGVMLRCLRFERVADPCQPTARDAQ